MVDPMQLGPRVRPTMPIRRRLSGALLGVVLVTLLTPLGTSPTDAATDRLPNLRMGNIADTRITTTSTGRRLLRLSTYILNAGPGPLELRGSRPSTNRISMTVTQRIRRSDGTWRVQPSAATAFYAGDGHDHWHIASIQDMALLRSDGRWLRGAKIGFCFFDTGRYLSSTPGSPSGPGYFESSCGRRAALTSKMGISIGWGDKYQWSLAYQWIDITGVPGGTYLIRTSVDPLGQIMEASEADNCGWASVRFSSTGSTVTLLSQGKECIVAGIGGSGGWNAGLMDGALLADSGPTIAGPTIAAPVVGPPLVAAPVIGPSAVAPAGVASAGVAWAGVASEGVAAAAVAPAPPSTGVGSAVAPLQSSDASAFRCAIPT